MTKAQLKKELCSLPSKSVVSILMELYDAYPAVKENLDVRTITMGISLINRIDSDVDRLCERIYDKITGKAENLVKTGEAIESEYGIPIVNKRISVTPIGLIGAASCKSSEDFVKIAKTLDRAARNTGVNFIGGYTALVSKGMTDEEKLLIESIPEALSSTERIMSSVVAGSTKTGINMDAVRLMGDIILKTAEATKDNDSIGCTKLVVLCNAPDDNPFMAGAFHGVTEPDVVINVGVSGPGVVKTALEKTHGADFMTLCETIKKTAFKVTRVGELVAQEASRRLNVPFGIIDLSLAPTPTIGDSVADILHEIGTEYAGAPGTTAALAMLNDQVIYAEAEVIKHGKTMDFVNKNAMEGTMMAHNEGGVPNILIHIPDTTEQSLGELFFFFEFACGVSGYMLGVNPFDQPGVESYKKNMFKLLGKPGY
mgnify:CR=1 FL=1